jgi:hypothetical protein
MNGRNNWELSLANHEDSPGIQKVFDDVDFKGDISVKFTRAPDPYVSFQNDGDNIILPIVRDPDTQEIIAVGTCVIRKEFVNGIVRNVGYLTGLKIMERYQKRLNCIRQAYEFLGQQTASYGLYYYTTILKSNEAAIRLLEKRHHGMPPYLYQGEYTVYCLGTGFKASSKGYTFTRGHTPAMAAFYQKHLPRYNLAPVNERLHGLSDLDFYALSSPTGDILAACAIWNQQSYKQYIISNYSGIYQALSHLPTHWFGYPKMPKPGSSANYASIASLIIPEENMEISQMFLALICQEAKQYDFIMLGLFENHLLTSILENHRHIKYQSRLYTVDYSQITGRSESLDERQIMLEVGCL